MNIRHLLIVGLTTVNSLLLPLNGRAGTSAGLNPEESSESIVVHYGLNDSHSRSWVQESGDGVVGISYFQRFVGDYTQGTLLYRTISPSGSVSVDTVTTGVRLEKSVLLYDSLSLPHIFVARSNDIDQVVDHYCKDSIGGWQVETITHFYNEGGKFIYELSADVGPDHSFHLLLLKTRSDIDSPDFMDAWLGSTLYHLTNASGTWVPELIRGYDMAYTYDMYVKSSSRQDIKVDDDGFVHVLFSEQINGIPDPSRLLYATNKTGAWQVEIALNYDNGTRDDAGWFPSLCLDNDGIPYIATMYSKRVWTGSAQYCKLLLLKRLGLHSWQIDTIAEHDDGYYGGDGRNYTGGLNHLVFDSHNTPHILFADIASTHWPVLNQRLNVGNIRYGVYENGAWSFTTIYRQPRPTGFYSATEMFGMCLVVSENTDTIRAVGEELIVTGENQYSCRLVDFAWAKGPTDVRDDPVSSLPDRLLLSQNYPNPFNPETTIEFDLPRPSHVIITVYNVFGQQVRVLADRTYPAGNHTIRWDGTDHNGMAVSSGVYFYRLQVGDTAESKKMLLLK